MLATERRWWRDVDRAQLAFAESVHRREVARDRWEVRIRTAMRGVEPGAWWRCHRRIEAGERWVGGNKSARWVQRVVWVTWDRVVELAARRDNHLAALEDSCQGAEWALRGAIRNPVAAFGLPETARRLGLPRSTVEALHRGRPLRPADRQALCASPADGPR